MRASPIIDLHALCLLLWLRTATCGLERETGSVASGVLSYEVKRGGAVVEDQSLRCHGEVEGRRCWGDG